MHRREFIKVLGLGTVAAAFFTSEALAVEAENSSKLKRSLQPPRMHYGNAKNGCSGCEDYGLTANLM